MNRHDDIILTHYSEIADETQSDVRRLQAEMTRSILRALGAMLGKPFKRSARSAQVLDRA